MANPTEPRFWVEDILDHLVNVISLYWNTVRTSKLASWGAGIAPTIIPLAITANNVGWGPSVAPAYMPSIQLTYDQGVRDHQRFMGKAQYYDWDIAITIIFRHTVSPADANRYGSRYCEILRETIERYHNYNNAGTIIDPDMRQYIPIAIMRESTNRIEEVAVETLWTIKAAHFSTNGQDPV